MEFFDINDPEIKNRLIVENKLAFAFPTRTPIVPGHTLICPKRPVSKVDDLADDELRAIFDLQKRLKKPMIEVFNAEGFNYAWNEGKDAGQSVPHFHLHILPRKKSDTGIFEYEPRKFLYRPGERETSPKEELSKIAELIRENI